MWYMGHNKANKFWILKVFEGVEMSKDRESKKIIAENFLCLMKYIDIYIQETHRSASTFKFKKIFSKAHYIQSPKSQRQIQNFKKRKRKVSSHA